MNPDHPLITPPVLDAWLDVPATGAVMGTVVEQLYDFHLAHQLVWPRA